MSKSNVLFLMTGSIACYKACHVISRLVQAGHDVQVVASAAALQFVGTATLEGLTGQPVVSDLWEKGRAMDHIHLIRKADLVIAAPATANFINRISQGLGDDLMTTLFLAHDFKKPFLIAPAMNTTMYLHPATQASLTRLKSFGVEILETASGVLACGETGFGKLLEPDLILQEVLGRLKSGIAVAASSAVPVKTPRAVKVLVTAGGTREALDEVRSITNTSTGRSGALLAERLSELGADVTLLRSSAGAKASPGLPQKEFTSFADLERELSETLKAGGFTHVIQMAAVSDYGLASTDVDGKPWPAGGKIPSDREVTLHLKPLPKLIRRLKDWGGPSLEVVGFKLTAGASTDERRAAAKKVLESAAMVIGNDLSEIDDAHGNHPYVLYTAKAALPLDGFEEMAAALSRFIFQKELP